MLLRGSIVPTFQCVTFVQQNRDSRLLDNRWFRYPSMMILGFDKYNEVSQIEQVQYVLRRRQINNVLC